MTSFSYDRAARWIPMVLACTAVAITGIAALGFITAALMKGWPASGWATLIFLLLVAALRVYAGMVADVPNTGCNTMDQAAR